MSQQNFQVNLRGIIDLLSNHLYSGPQVYVREMLQNAVDAITARRAIEDGLRGEVSFEIIPPRSADDSADGKPTPPTLIVQDNGIGLTEPEVHEFLATIGRSSKRGEFSRDDFIGQFGIGLLSAFLVCEEIVVITRSVKPDSPVVQWKGRVDGTYNVSTIDLDFEAGTRVYLRAKPGCNDFFEYDFVVKTAEYFGQYLESEITVSSGNNRTTINETPPWKLSNGTAGVAHDLLIQFGRETFEQDFLDVIPLNIPNTGVEGVMYVLPHSISVNAKRAHRVYLKNMLLAETVDNLLPDWAFFVKGVINVTQLRPTAAREAFYEDQALEETRAAIGDALRNYLINLANTDRVRLDRLIALHFLPIKALAVEDDEFFRIFINWLPFETSLGMMTIEEYRNVTDNNIRFVATRDQFRQIAGVAAAQNICVINAGYVYDNELIEKMARMINGISVNRVDVSEMVQDFKELELDEREQVFDLIKLADLVLQPFRCQAEVKKFEPAELPTLYTSNDEATFLRSLEQSKEKADELWSGVLDSISSQPAAAAHAQLCLNYNSPLIRQLASIDDRELQRSSIEMLYVQALLLGHFPLGTAEMGLLGTGLLKMIEHSISLKGNGDT
ncbi:MAG: HSP90 family protein [Planctomycetota bacterium]